MRKLNKESLEKAQKFLNYRKNPTLWMEECAYIPTGGGDKLIDLYDPQKRVLGKFYDDHYLVLLKSRQTGFSTLSQLVVAHTTTFYPNIVCGIISRDGAEASDFNRKVVDIIEKQPSWLQPGFDKGFKNAQSFKTNNGSQLWSSAVSPANPGAVFRGKAITILIVDEAAFIRYIDEAWTAMGPALSKAQTVAKQLGIPYGTVVLSTPNRTEGIGKWFFMRWQQAKASDTGLWKHDKIYWKEVPDFVNDPKWYQTQCDILENNKNKIAQELELQFVPVGGLFDEEIYKKLQQIDDRPIEIINIRPNVDIYRYAAIHTNRFYLIGVDTASEFGTDYSTIEVLDYTTMEQVLEFRSKMKVKEFIHVVKLVANICPKHLLIVENNSYGNQVCEELHGEEDSHMYNIYGTWKQQMVAQPGKHSSKYSSKRPKRRVFQPGVSTNVKTRPLIFDALYSYVVENIDSIKSERLAMELVSLVDKGNKVEADLGANDDLVIAYAFCCYARMYLKETVQAHAESVTDDGDESVSWMKNFNNNAPLVGEMLNKRDDLSGFNKSADKYINKNFHKLSGKTINMLELMTGKKHGLF